MIRLTKKQVISMHQAMISATGGSDGIRDEGLLDSALETPFQTFGCTDIYPTLFQKKRQGSDFHSCRITRLWTAISE